MAKSDHEGSELCKVPGRSEVPPASFNSNIEPGIIDYPKKIDRGGGVGSLGDYSSALSP